MTKRISRRAVLLFIALFLLMPGCSDRQDAQDEPDLPDPETNEPPLVEPQPSPGPEPAQPVEPTPAPKDKIGGENPVIAEGIWQINTSYFTQNNMTVDSIFVAGDDRVLFAQRRRHCHGKFVRLLFLTVNRPFFAAVD